MKPLNKKNKTTREFWTRLADLLGQLWFKFNHLRRRERMLIVLFLLTILFSFYFRVMFQPQMRELRDFRLEIEGIENQITQLEIQIPNLPELRSDFHKAEKDLESLKDDLSKVDARLPSQGRIPNLLGELVKKASAGGVEFVSIKPKKSENKGDYQKLILDIKINAIYEDFVNYLNRLESITNLFKTIQVDIREIDDEGLRGKLDITLVLAILFKKTDGDDISLEGKKGNVPVFNLSRNPFSSNCKVETVEKIDLVISGITMGKLPIAIINDEIYKIGDSIKERKIIELHPDKVVFSSGSDTVDLILTK